jgi:hypothetical protein
VRASACCCCIATSLCKVQGDIPSPVPRGGQRSTLHSLAHMHSALHTPRAPSSELQELLPTPSPVSRSRSRPPHTTPALPALLHRPLSKTVACAAAPDAAASDLPAWLKTDHHLTNFQNTALSALCPSLRALWPGVGCGRRSEERVWPGSASAVPRIKPGRRKLCRHLQRRPGGDPHAGRSAEHQLQRHLGAPRQPPGCCRLALGLSRECRWDWDVGREEGAWVGSGSAVRLRACKSKRRRGGGIKPQKKLKNRFAYPVGLSTSRGENSWATTQRAAPHRDSLELINNRQ